ncbi:MAG: hypothetical protein AAF202_03005, partial [Pseudomonadota bacterium]
MQLFQVLTAHILVLSLALVCSTSFAQVSHRSVSFENLACSRAMQGRSSLDRSGKILDLHSRQMWTRVRKTLDGAANSEETLDRYQNSLAPVLGNKWNRERAALLERLGFDLENRKIPKLTSLLLSIDREIERSLEEWNQTHEQQISKDEVIHLAFPFRRKVSDEEFEWVHLRYLEPVPA